MLALFQLIFQGRLVTFQPLPCSLERLISLINSSRLSLPTSSWVAAFYFVRVTGPFAGLSTFPDGLEKNHLESQNLGPPFRVCGVTIALALYFVFYKPKTEGNKNFQTKIRKNQNGKAKKDSLYSVFVTVLRATLNWLSSLGLGQFAPSSAKTFGWGITPVSFGMALFVGAWSP